jgi:purine-binding chemotaxis protein CheW
MSVLVLLLGNERYGVPTSQVREVIFHQDPTPVPRTAPFVLGVVNLRGQILPVVDLRARFGLPPEKGRYIVVLELDDLAVGVTVDDVLGVEELREDEVEPPSRMLTTVDNRFLRGIVRRDEALLMVLDMNIGLLRPDEVAELADMSGRASADV